MLTEFILNDRILAKVKQHQMKSTVELPHFYRHDNCGHGREKATNEPLEKVHAIKNSFTKRFSAEKRQLRWVYFEYCLI